MRYVRPESLDELLGFLRAGGAEGAVFLAGGTDLMPRHEMGAPLPHTLIDVKHLPELAGIAEGEGGLEIGSLTTVEMLRRDPRVRGKYPALAEAADQFAAGQIRHRATIGGNLANASPAGDLIPPLAALGAKLRLAGAGGEREVPVGDFFRGPGATVLRPGEVLRSVLLPEGLGSRFFKLGLRRGMAISVVNFAVAFQVEAGRFTRLRIAAGAVAPTVVGLDEYAEAVLRDPAAVEGEIGLVDEAIAPIDDIRASARYRRMALKNVLRHTLRELLEGPDE